MATEVYRTETIVLQDGTEVDLRPLPIAKLRKFTRIWSDHLKSLKTIANNNAGQEDLDEMELVDNQFNVFIKLCALSLESQLKEDKTEKQFTAYLEEVLDEPTLYRILYITGGLQLGDESNPNLQTPAMVEDGII